MKPVALAAAIAALAPASNALASVRRDHADIVHKIRMAAPEPEPNPAAVGEHLNTFQKRFGPGRMTFYDVGLGACGNWNTANEFVVALNSAQFGGYAVYPGPNCFKSIVIEYNGRQVGATIVDECPTCGYAELDLSRGLFAQFAPESAGVFYANWWFTDGSGAPPAPAPPPPPPPPAPTTTEAPPPPPPSTTEIIPPPSSTSSEDAPEQSAEAEQTETPPPNNLYTFGKVVVQLAGIIGHGAGPA